MVGTVWFGVTCCGGGALVTAGTCAPPGVFSACMTLLPAFASVAGGGSVELVR